jgi:hypothetical protein
MKTAYVVLIILIALGIFVYFLLLPILYLWGVPLAIKGRLNFDATSSGCFNGEINYFITNDGGDKIDLNKLTIYEKSNYEENYQVTTYTVDKDIIEPGENATLKMLYCSNQSSRCYVKIETEKNVINNILVARFQKCDRYFETAFKETEIDYYFVVGYTCSAEGRLVAFFVNNKGYKSLDAKEIKITVKNTEGNVLDSVFCGNGIIEPNTLFECNNTIDIDCKNITVSYSGYGISK